MFRVRKGSKISRKDKKERKEKKYNALDLPLQSDAAQFKKICANNSPFADATTLATYDWKNVLPLGRHPLHHIEYKRPQLPSLKSIARRHVAINCRHLEIEHFESVPFTEWEKIWKQILFLHLDSPGIFDLFASVFSQAGRNIHCHRQISKNDVMADSNVEKLATLRSNAIEVLTMLSRNHRVENAFSNIYIPEFVRYVNALMYQPLVVIDTTGSSSSSHKDSYVRLLSLNNLLALNFSDNDIIDDSFLSCIFTCIANEGKLTELRVLVIRNCRKVTPKGLMHFLAAISRFSCYSQTSLALVETDLELPVDFERNNNVFRTNADTQIIVKGTKWFSLVEPWKRKILSDLPLVQKVRCLLKNYSEYINPLQSTNDVLTDIKSRIILDLMIHKHAIDQAGLDYSALLEAWVNRFSQVRTNSCKNTFCYIIDKNRSVRSSVDEENNATRKNKGIIFRASERHQANTSTIKRKKPQQSFKKDYQGFFNL